MPKMPRGALPLSRSGLARAKPFRAHPAVKVFIPCGRFPSSDREIGEANPFTSNSRPATQFIAWPLAQGTWDCSSFERSVWAEEAFAKSCASPQVLLTSSAVAEAVQTCASGNMAKFMSEEGFKQNSCAWLNGEYLSVDWTCIKRMKAAVEGVGPIKLILHVPELLTSNQTLGVACLFGYGPTEALMQEFAVRSIRFDNLASASSCCALYLADSIFLIDWLTITSTALEAWVRFPTTIRMAISN